MYARRRPSGDHESCGTTVDCSPGGVMICAAPSTRAKITIYVVNHRRDYLPVIEESRVALFGDHKPVDTLVGVATLSNPDYLMEVDAIAVIDQA